MVALLAATALAADQAFYRRVDDAMLAFWNHPGLATRQARTLRCLTATSSPACAAIRRGVYLDEHRAAVMDRVRRFNMDRTTHAMLPSSCSASRDLTEIVAAYEFGCAIQEVRRRREPARRPGIP